MGEFIGWFSRRRRYVFWSVRMPLPVQQFTPETFEQANPFMTGMQQGISTAFMAPQLQQQLKASQLANALNQIKLQYAPQMTQADLAYKQAQTPYLQAETGLTNERAKYYPSDIQSQINQRNVQTQFLPLMDLANLQNTLTNQARLGQSTSRFGPAYQLARLYQSLSPAGKAEFEAQPGMVEALNHAMQMIGSQIGKPSEQPSANLSELINQQLQKLYPGSKEITFPSADQQQQASPLSQASQGVPIDAATQSIAPGLLNSQQNVPDSFQSQEGVQIPTLTNDQVSNIQDVLHSEALKKSQTAAQMNQRLYSVSARRLYDQVTPLLPSVSKFTGISGKAALANSAIQASLGRADPDYTNYLKFKNQVSTLLSNEYRRVMGGQATDKEAQLMSKLTVPNFTTITPSQLMDLYHNLDDVLKAQESAIALSPAKQQQLLQKDIVPSKSPIESSSVNQQYSQPDLEFTAKKYGITVDQVKQRLGIK